MDQKPLRATAPLDPPTADVARAYLEEVGTVSQRREERVDRRGMAQVALWEACALAVYLCVMMFGFGGATVASTFILLISVFLLWIQLSGELKESYGFQARGGLRTRSLYIAFAVIVVATATAGISLQLNGVDIPLGLRFVPGALVLLVFGGLAVRDIQKAGAANHERGRMPLPVTARAITITMGALIGAAILVAAAADPFPASVFSLVLMFCMGGWWIATQVSDRLPALGALWSWPQWSAFATGWCVLAGVVLMRFHTSLDMLPSAIAAASVTMLFTVGAFAAGRNAG